MKIIGKLFLGVMLLLAIEFSGCVADGGYVSGSESVYYGPGPDPWFHDGVWLDGRHGYRHAPGAYIHPPAYHGRGPGPGRPPGHDNNHPNPGNHGPAQHPNPPPSHGQDHHPNSDRH